MTHGLSRDAEGQQKHSCIVKNYGTSLFIRPESTAAPQRRMSDLWKRQGLHPLWGGVNFKPPNTGFLTKTRPSRRLKEEAASRDLFRQNEGAGPSAHGLKLIRQGTPGPHLRDRRPAYHVLPPSDAADSCCHGPGPPRPRARGRARYPRACRTPPGEPLLSAYGYFILTFNLTPKIRLPTFYSLTYTFCELSLKKEREKKKEKKNTFCLTYRFALSLLLFFYLHCASQNITTVR